MDGRWLARISNKQAVAGAWALALAWALAWAWAWALALALAGFLLGNWHGLGKREATLYAGFLGGYCDAMLTGWQARCAALGRPSRPYPPRGATSSAGRQRRGVAPGVVSAPNVHRLDACLFPS